MSTARMIKTQKEKTASVQTRKPLNNVWHEIVPGTDTFLPRFKNSVLAKAITTSGTQALIADKDRRNTPVGVDPVNGRDRRYTI